MTKTAARLMEGRKEFWMPWKFLWCMVL